MQMPARGFVGVVIIAALVIGFLLVELRAERSTAADLREHVAQLSAAPQLPGPPSSAPQVASQASAPATQPTGEVLQGSQMPGGAPSPPTRRAIFSETIREELGLTKEQGESFVQLLRSGGSEADYVALIGSEKYEQYQALQRAQSREQRVSQLRTSLADTRHPLTDAQASQLDRLLEAEQQRRAEDAKARPKPTDPRALLEYDEATLRATQVATERMYADANAFLSVEQAAVLQNQLGSSLSQQEDNLRLRRLQLGTGSR